MPLTQQQLAITHYQAITIAGNSTEALFAKITAQTIGPKLSSDFFANAPGENNRFPIYLAAINELRNSDPYQKIAYMLNSCKKELTKNLPPTYDYKNTLLHVFLPSANSARAKYFNFPTIKMFIQRSIPQLAKIKIEFSNESNCIINKIYELGTKLINNEYETIIIGGIDSLINNETLLELSSQKCLATNQCPAGIAPGEAAVFLYLQNSKNHVQIRTASNFSDFKIPIDLAIHTFRTIDDPIIWHQSTQIFWPQITINDLLTNLWLGEIGAATIPLSIALAAQIIANKQAMHILVSETNENSLSGLVLCAGEQNA